MTLRSVAQRYELAVGGKLSPSAADALDSFKVVNADEDCTYLTGRVERQGHLYDVLAAIGTLKIDLISLRPITGEDNLGIETSRQECESWMNVEVAG